MMTLASQGLPPKKSNIAGNKFCGEHMFMKCARLVQHDRFHELPTVRMFEA